MIYGALPQLPLPTLSLRQAGTSFFAIAEKNEARMIWVKMIFVYGV